MAYLNGYQYYENAGNSPEFENWGSYQYTSLEDIVNNFKTKLFNEGESMLSLQVEKNKIFDYLTASKDQAEKAFQEINPAVRNEAKTLKQILKESNLEYGKFLSTEAGDSYKKIGQDIIQDADSFFRQRF